MNISNRKCYNCGLVQYLAKSCTKPSKISTNLKDGGFIAKANLTKNGTKFIMLRCFVKSNKLMCLLDSRVARSFLNPKVALRLNLKATRMA
jgi:hypothetical protein